MRRPPIRFVSLAIFSITGLAVAQTPVPTGIQRTATIGLTRAEGKISIGTGDPVEFIEDGLGAGFQQADYTNYMPPPLPTAQVTIIGPAARRP